MFGKRGVGGGGGGGVCSGGSGTRKQLERREDAEGERTKI